MIEIFFIHKILNKKGDKLEMKKKVTAYLVLLFMLTFMGGCANPAKQERQSSPAPLTKVENIKVDIGALRGPTAISIVKMIDAQPSLGKGVKVNYAVEQSPEVLSAKLLSEEMEFATIPTNMAATLYNKGVPYQLAAVNTWGVMYLVSNGVPINRWADLKGQQIGAVSKGASSDVVFKYLLSKNGLNPDKDVTLNYNPSPVEMAQMIIAGKTDIAVLPEPWVSMVQRKNPQIKVMLDLQKEWIKLQGSDTPFAQTCLVVNKNFASKHPEIVNSFLEEYAQSIDWVNHNVQPTATLLKNHDLGIPAELAQAAIPRCNLRYMSSQDARPAVEKYLKVLLDFSPETIGGKVPDDKFYYQK